MTGKEATFGAQFLAGASAAVADINAKGGVLGKPLKLITGDDQCDPKQARAVAEQLSASGAVLAAGHFCSSSSIPASSVYNEQGVVQISPGSTNPDYTDKRPGPYSYRVCGRDDQQGGVAGAYLAKEFKDKKIAILHDKTAYGQGLADQTKKAMNAAGKQEVFFEAITPGEKDYTATVSRLKQNGIDVVFLGGYHTEAGLIIRQMRAQGMKTILVGGDALVSSELGTIAGDDVEGTMMTFSPDPRRNPAAKDVVAALAKERREPRGLCGLRLRRRSGLGAGRRKGSLDGWGQSGGRSELDRVRHRARQVQVRCEGRSEPSALCLLSLGQEKLRTDRI